MADKNKEKAEEILNFHTHQDSMGPENLGEDFFEGDGVIGDALDNAGKEKEKEKEIKAKAIQEKASKKRKTVNKIKKAAGVRKGKQSKFPTRSHNFVGKSMSDRAIHLILNHRQTEIYKDGADFCPRVLMGIPAYGKSCKRNAFEHLITIQEKITEARGNDVHNAPSWIIMSNDTSMLMDRNLISRLEELKPTTHAAGAYGFEKIRASGKWYQIDGTTEQKLLRGCYIQANTDNLEWDFIVGNKFKDSPRYRVIIIHGPFIAVRGETFMDIDFSDMATNMRKGFYHYMAEISMECLKRRHAIAQIKTVSAQFENINNVRGEPDFQHDQSYFASKWQPFLPASIYPNV